MDFWNLHGWFFLIFIALFPRITMLVAGICFMSWAYPVWFWIGWVITPRLVVAILATSIYWNTNPVLCVIAWLLCVGGESAEKKSLGHKA